MKNPRYFVGVIIIFSILLLFVDLPKGIFEKTITIPYLNRSFVTNPSGIHINFGPIKIQKELEYKLGLDLQGGTQLVYSVNMDGIASDKRNDAFESAREVIDRRINFFGVTEPSIQTLKLEDEYRIIIELPGFDDQKSAIDVIGKTAELSFWEGRAASEGALMAMATQSAGMYPSALPIILNGEPVKTALSGTNLKSAAVVFDNQGGGGPQVQLKFSPEGAKLFAEITKRNVGKSVAIVLDDQVLSAPVVQQQIIGGDAVISGSFTSDAAKNLSIQLNAGALPAPLELIAQSRIAPSLGIGALKDSVWGAFVGMIAVVGFMVFIYKKEGILASCALGIYTILILFIFQFIPVTLTLAGIAGFILSIGMAVDANILIFERMKEELREGRTRKQAIRLGFSRAWTSIRDSNISSLITCAVLFYFGSGIVRGFALSLAIGIVVSMFTAITITRNLLKVTINEK